MCSLRTWLAALAGLLAAGSWLSAENKKGPQPACKVAYQDLHLKVIVNGVVDVKDDHAVKSEVKAGSRGRPEIKWIVANGSQVKKGDLIVEMDDSYLQELVLQRKIDYFRAKSDVTAAELYLPIKKAALELARKQAANADKSAEKEVETAKLELKKFDDGDKEVYRKDIKARLADAEANLALWRERVVLAEKRLKEGTTTDGLVKAKRQKREACAVAVDRVKDELQVLDTFTLPQYRKQLEAKIALAETELESARKTAEVYAAAVKDAEVSLKTAEAALEANRAVLEQKESLHKDCLEQVRKCKIYAPRSGQVVRGVREEKGDGPEAKQTMVARGDNVRYGQKLLTIPDLSVMAIQVRLHEGLIGYLRKGQSATVEVAGLKPLRAHVADVAAGADAKEERPELTVKYYSATLHFDEPVDELSHRRGARALCTIATDLRAEHVLAIPVRAVAAPPEKGKKPRCLVVTPNGVVEREVEVGLSDGRMVEIKSGLKEGESVVEDRR